MHHRFCCGGIARLTRVLVELPCYPQFEEFSEYVEKLSCASGKVIILGDFNIHFWDTSSFAYKRFVNILETFNCVQHIDKPTHNSGHLLDYIYNHKKGHLWCIKCVCI